MRSVSIVAGRMELNRMPSPPSSNARLFVSPIVARRMLLDRTRLDSGCLTEYEVIVKTLAAFDFLKYGRAARIIRTWLRKDKLTAFSHAASSNVSKAPEI